jgi:branched-chain amino acid transport system permease protein
MLLQQVINGLTLGVIYALLALGYSLIFGTLRFINFAHGPVATAGAYLAWYTSSKMGMPFLLACLIGILSAGVIGTVMDQLGYKPIRKSGSLTMLLVSVGFAYIVETGLQLIFGTESMDFSMKKLVVYHFGNVYINSISIWILAVSLILMVVLQWYINHTKAGTSIRAIAQDRDTSALMGVNVNSAISLTFFLGSALGGVSAIMMSVYYSQIYPTMGSSLGQKGFAAVVMGGIGSVPGAMLGGVLMGVIESFVAFVTNTQVAAGASFVVLILILVIRPSGLLGKEAVKD